MRRTLEALVEGRPLPEDEQLKEREKEILLREEYAKSRDSKERTAGKAPPTIKEAVSPSVKERVPTVIAVPQNPPKPETPREDKSDQAPPTSVAQPPVVVGGSSEEKPKKMSR